MCFCIRISKELESSSEEIEEIIREIMKDICCYEHIFLSETDIAFFIGNVNNSREMSGFYETLQSELRDKLQCNVTIGVGGVQRGIEGMKASFQEAVEAVKARVIYGRNQVIHYKYLKASTSSISNIFEVDWKELSFHLKNGIKDNVIGFIESYIFKVAELGNVEITTVRMLCTNIVTVLTTVLNDMGKKVSDIFEPEYDIYTKIGTIDTLQDATIILSDFAERLVDYITASKGKKVNELIERAKNYIDSNYTKSELNLTDMAANLYVNQSYLSRTFKSETGESITDYILKLRINKSIEYITSTNLKAYEIAEKVGISDPHYFSICFKKYTGKSVNEYKKAINF
jgi:two-component system response regulator YesN